MYLFIDCIRSLEGRRIVDIEYFINQIQKRHEGGFRCSFIDMEYQSEIIQGLQSILYFKCKMCNIVSKLYTANISNIQSISVNKSVVNACQAIGLHFLYYIL